MALAMIPPHTFSLDVTMSVSPYLCSHFMPVPVMTVPVVSVVPVPPMPVELMVVDAMVVRREEERIFRGDTNDHSWYHCHGNRNPGSVIHRGPEPVPIVITIPEASEKIDTEQLRHHVNISLPAGNNDNFRRCGKLQRGWRRDFSLHLGFRILGSRFRGRRRFLNGWWRRRRGRRNANIDVHVCCADKRRGKNKCKSQHKECNPLHETIPPSIDLYSQNPPCVRNSYNISVKQKSKYGANMQYFRKYP
jgi:hypothetical protein